MKSRRMEALRTLGLQYPEAHEGIACEGTAVEKRTVRARDKAFLFVGAEEAMFKLGDSLPEATRLASQAPDRCKVGAHGWVTVRDVDAIPDGVLERWVDESYRLIAPKALVASLPPRGDARGDPAGAPRPKTAKKRAPRTQRPR